MSVIFFIYISSYFQHQACVVTLNSNNDIDSSCIADLINLSEQLTAVNTVLSCLTLILLLLLLLYFKEVLMFLFVWTVLTFS